MIRKWTKSHTMDEVLNLFDPLIKEWFLSRYNKLAPPQSFAVPLIHAGKNVLITSPTGSGKTLTAFISILNKLFLEGKSGRLEDRIYCIYVSPLKALANDIEKNLRKPLKEIKALASKNGIDLPDIRVAVRSGDTTQSDRQKMTHKPPHILITTPETLGIILSTKKFKENLRKVSYLIIDEIHDLCNSKRGVFLSLNMERLEHMHDPDSNPPCRIGLSATQAPIREIAKYLAGYSGGRKLRDMNIIEVDSSKALDLKVVTPPQDLNFTAPDVINNLIYSMLKDYIDNHHTTLIFTNTRAGTESVVYRLKSMGIEGVAAHHGSLSKDTRLRVEDCLKSGEMRAVVSSTSLELGIDVGVIDLVCQIGSPKSIAKGMQRIGRAGHYLYGSSKGRILALDRDDLVESAVLVNAAYSNMIDRTHILKNSLDVLAQCIVGMSLEQKWTVSDALMVIRGSYNFHNLKRSELLSVLNLLGQDSSMDKMGIYSKIWYDASEKTFGLKRGVRQIYNQNIGTIPQESSYDVLLYRTNMPLGSLSEKFVEKLHTGDVFILGGKSYEFIRTRGTTAYVKDARDKRPTVPSWAGEMMPRTYDLSLEIARFRRAFMEKLESGMSQRSILEWLGREYHVEQNGSVTIFNYMKEQYEFTRKFGRSMLPTDKKLLIEKFTDSEGRTNLIYHFCFGRRVNDALSRAMADKLSHIYKTNVAITLGDDNFMLTLPEDVPLEGIANLVSPEELEGRLMHSLRGTELFRQRFRHCAVRSFIILRNYKGQEISVRKQQQRVEKLMDHFIDDPECPIVREAYNEILNEFMDIKNARALLKDIESGKIEVHTMDSKDIPSPFGHNIVLQGYSDVVMMEDRSNMLRDLHTKVLEATATPEELSSYEFHLDDVNMYFSRKWEGRIHTRDDLLAVLKELPPINLFRNIPPTIFRLTQETCEVLEQWGRELMDSGDVQGVFKGGSVLYTTSEKIGLYYTLYGDSSPLSDEEKEMLSLIKQKKASTIKRTGRDVVRALLRKYAIYTRPVPGTGSKYEYVVRPQIKQTDKNEAIRTAITEQLSLVGMLTLDELSFMTFLSTDDVRKGLEKLVRDGIVVKGNFVLGKIGEQYMLSQDHTRLLNLSQSSGDDHVSTEKVDILKWEDIERSKAAGLLVRVNDIDDYFDRYMFAMNQRSIALRLRDFRMEDWLRRLSLGEIIQGRFISGSVSHIRAEMLDDFVCALRKEPIIENKTLKIYSDIVKASRRNRSERKGTKYIKTVPKGISIIDLSRRHDIPLDELKDIVRWLEKNMYVVRDGARAAEVRLGISNVNSYVIPDTVCDGIMEPDKLMELAEKGKPYQPVDPQVRDEALKRLIGRFIGLFGPVNENAISQVFVLPPEKVRAVIGIMESEGSICVVNVERGGTMVASLNFCANKQKYMSGIPPEKRRELVSFDGMEIFPILDPYMLHKRNEVRMAFGDGWYSPVIHEGRIIGKVDMWKTSGCLDIHDMTLFGDEIDTGKYISGTLEGLLRWQDYYEALNASVLRVFSIDGRPVPALDEKTVNILKKSDFKVLNRGFAVYGEVLDLNLSKEQILNMILYKQHIHPENKFTSAIEAINKLGGIRSEYPLSIRVRTKVYDIQELARHHRLVGGKLIPSYFMYTTMDLVSLYNRAKGSSLDSTGDYVLSHIQSNMPISNNKLESRLNLSPREYHRIKKFLYDNLFIVKTANNKYLKVREAEDLSVSQARTRVVEMLFENFGILRAEDVARLLGNEFSMYEIRKILESLYQDGKIEKGFIEKDRNDLYFIQPDIVNMDIDKIPIVKGKWILTYDDPFWLYLSTDIRAMFNVGTYHAIMDGTRPVGVFKADIKPMFNGPRSGRRTPMKLMEVFDFKGSEDIEHFIELFGRMHNLVIKWKREKTTPEGKEDYQQESDEYEIYDGSDMDDIYRD